MGCGIRRYRILKSMKKHYEDFASVFGRGPEVAVEQQAGN